MLKPLTVERMLRLLMRPEVRPSYVLNAVISDPNGNPTFMKIEALMLCPDTGKVHIKLNGIDEEDECHKKAQIS